VPKMKTPAKRHSLARAGSGWTQERRAQQRSLATAAPPAPATTHPHPRHQRPCPYAPCWRRASHASLPMGRGRGPARAVISQPRWRLGRWPPRRRRIAPKMPGNALQFSPFRCLEPLHPFSRLSHRYFSALALRLLHLDVSSTRKYVGGRRSIVSSGCRTTTGSSCPYNELAAAVWQYEGTWRQLLIDARHANTRGISAQTNPCSTWTSARWPCRTSMVRRRDR